MLTWHSVRFLCFAACQACGVLFLARCTIEGTLPTWMRTTSWSSAQNFAWASGVGYGSNRAPKTKASLDPAKLAAAKEEKDVVKAACEPKISELTRELRTIGLEKEVLSSKLSGSRGEVNGLTEELQALREESEARLIKVRT